MRKKWQNISNYGQNKCTNFSEQSSLLRIYMGFLVQILRKLRDLLLDKSIVIVCKLPRKYLERQLNNSLNFIQIQTIKKSFINIINRGTQFGDTIQFNRQFSHFISIPIGENEAIKQVYNEWKYQALAKIQESNPGLENAEKLFINPENLHLTIVMLPLREAGQLYRCKQALIDIQDKIQSLIKLALSTSFNQESEQINTSSNNNLINFGQNLQYFGDTAQQTKLLYLPIKLNETLLDLSSLIIQQMLDCEVVDRSELEANHIKLNLDNGRYEQQNMHVTLLNTAFLKVIYKEQKDRINQSKKDKSQPENNSRDRSQRGGFSNSRGRGSRGGFRGRGRGKGKKFQGKHGDREQEVPRLKPTFDSSLVLNDVVEFESIKIDKILLCNKFEKTKDSRNTYLCEYDITINK